MNNTALSPEDISVLAWLSSVKNFNGKLGMRFLENIERPIDLFSLSEKVLSGLLPPAALKAFINQKNNFTPEMISKKIRDAGAHFISIYDTEYPMRLRSIPDAPLGLFIIGNLPADTVPSVAVIGARNCSEYGKHVAAEIGRYLGEHGIQLVSGMAYGIDSISQSSALEAGGTSMAVLGSGVDICYPLANKTLYEQLREKGGIISTYGMGEAAVSGNFPPRNRIVSGLSDAVIVVEARQKSGTIITVDMALDQGREVYAVPGRITDRLSDGCNGLIGQGAQVFLSPEIFLVELMDNLKNKPEITQDTPRHINTLHRQFNGTEHIPENLSPDAKKVYLALDLMPQNVEAICRKLNSEYSQNNVSSHTFSDRSISNSEVAPAQQYTYTEVSMILMQLMLDNHALQVSPGCFVKKAE